MEHKIVRYRLSELPDLTLEQIAQLKRLAARPDSEVDMSDIPELTEEQWKGAQFGRFYAATRQDFPAQIEAEILEWLKVESDDVNELINVILRRAMARERARSADESLTAAPAEKHEVAA